VQAPLAVAVEVRALDVGPRVVRAFRLSRGISEEGLTLGLDLPFEAGRPVSVELFLPDDPQPVRATGLVVGVRPEDEASEGEAARPRGITFTRIEPDARQRVARYVTERLSIWMTPSA
jgi:hypothetical protein